jgi:hypothetical protein
MNFWAKLDAFIKENSINDYDYNKSKIRINQYLKGTKLFSWDRLGFLQQNLLLEFELESGIKGLTPKDKKVPNAFYM